MNAPDALALLPLLLLAGTAVVVMLGIAVKRSYELTAGLTLLGLAASFVSVFGVAPLVPRQVGSLLLFDGVALFFLGVFFPAAKFLAFPFTAWLRISQTVVRHSKPVSST